MSWPQALTFMKMAYFIFIAAITRWNVLWILWWPMFYIAWWGNLDTLLHGPSLGNLLDQISTGAAWPRPRGNLWRDMRRWVETGDGGWRGEWRICGNWIIHAGSRLDARRGLVIGCADWFCCGLGQGWWQCACVTVTIRCTASLGLLFKYLWRQVSFA